MRKIVHSVTFAFGENNMSFSEIGIVPASHHHLEQVVEIYNQAILDGFSTADMEVYQPEEKLEWFKSHNQQHPLLLALDKEDVLGWASLSAYRPGRKAFSKVREFSVYIHRAHRSKGVASILLDHIRELAPLIGIEYLLAIILACNKRSIHFVENKGFKLWATLPLLADFEGSKFDHLYYGLDLKKDSTS